MKNSKKVFKILLLFAFILIQTAANSEEVTFTAVSNAYIKADKAHNAMTPSIEKLLKVKGDINASGSDFVLFLGNNISSADTFDVVMFAKIINKIHKPIYTILGSKDVQRGKRLSKKEYFRLLNKFSDNKTSKLPCAKKLKGFVFVFTDGINETVPVPKAYYKDSDFVFLEKTLEKYKNKNIIIVSHFPLLDEDGETKQVYNPDMYRTIVKRYPGVKAIISGYGGSEFEIEDENGVKYINIPSLNKAGEYSVLNVKTFNDKVLIKTKIISVE